MYLSNSLYILPYRVSAHLRLMEDGMALKAAGLAIISGDSGAVFSGIHTR